MNAEPPDAGLLRAGPAHARAMAAIHEAAFPPAERWGAAAIATTLALPGVLGLLAPAGGMALARLAADEAELLTLAVLPARQRRGLGRRLLAAAMAQAAAQRSVAMFLEVKASNDGALAVRPSGSVAIETTV
jgi:ribosomal-protein-alanine N-acetyltransferase